MKTLRMAWSLGVVVLLGARGEAASAVAREDLANEITAFLHREMAAHLAAVPTLDPPPERVFGSPTSGEFTWGTFMRALGEFYEMSGEKALAGRDVASWVGRIGLIEARGSGKAFSQLYAAMALRSFGKDLGTNPVWQSMGEAERAAWRGLLDPGRFYDREKRQVINLPDNYVGVAVRLLAISWEMGLADRAALDALVDRAAAPFKGGTIYFDDLPPVGRFDRYSSEYARNLWITASIAGRRDVLDLLRPSLTAQMRLFWDLVGPDGYGYPWGRTLGLIGYLDTLEILAFLAQNPEFRPAPLTDLAAAFHATWRTVRADYGDTRHFFGFFAFGRGYYAALGPDREWQQTVSALGKIAAARGELFGVLAREGVSELAEVPRWPAVARFEWFRRGDRPAGVWLVRQDALRFALPITTGTFSGNADYLPAPHGLPGFGSPVQQSYPALVPFVELASGETLVAGDGADEIEPGPDGRSLRVVWRRWARPRAPGQTEQMRALELKDVGLRSEVLFRLEDGRLVRQETWSSTTPVRAKRIWMAVTARGGAYRPESRGGKEWHLLSGAEGALGVSVARSDVPFVPSVAATGDSPLGRSFRGGLPLHLLFEAKDVAITPGRPVGWTVVLDPAADATR